MSSYDGDATLYLFSVFVFYFWCVRSIQGSSPNLCMVPVVVAGALRVVVGGGGTLELLRWSLVYVLGGVWWLHALQ